MRHRALSSGQPGRADAHAAREGKSGVARSHFGSTGVGTERSLFFVLSLRSRRAFLSFSLLSQMPNAVLKLLSLLDSFFFLLSLAI